MPSRLIAPAPASNQAHIPKVASHITVTIESTMPTTPSIPVATISGQQVTTLYVDFYFLLSVFVAVLNLFCLYNISGSLQQLAPPYARKHSHYQRPNQCPHRPTPDLYISFASRYEFSDQIGFKRICIGLSLEK